ncbi:MAG: putative esterase [Phenylobacterium sp.]|jgi:predicted alpha/beta superfamily hydrolase|nr:putative esterase [Phenylobacterium sp.]
MLRRLLRLTVATLAFAWASAASAGLKIVETGPAAQYDVQRLVLHSDRIDRDFLIEVTSPRTPILPGQKMPAIYALDMGYWIAGPVGRMLSTSGAMRPAYVIAIGYLPGQERARNVDLVHPRFTRGGETFGGGGAAFEAVLLDEIRPLLEAKYPLDPGRAYLFGHSFGGMFATEVLADRPEAFAGYLIASATVLEDETLAARLAAAARKGAGRRVYVAWGGVEAERITKAGAVVAKALGGPRSTFTLRRQVYAGENHGSYYPRLIVDAFPWLLPKPAEHHAIAFDTALASRYVGTYRLQDGRTTTVYLKDGRYLMGQLTGMPAADLFPENKTDFFVKGFDAQVVFDASTGPSPGLTLRVGGADARALRVP